MVIEYENETKLRIGSVICRARGRVGRDMCGQFVSLHPWEKHPSGLARAKPSFLVLYSMLICSSSFVNCAGFLMRSFLRH